MVLTLALHCSPVSSQDSPHLPVSTRGCLKLSPHVGTDLTPCSKGGLQVVTGLMCSCTEQLAFSDNHCEQVTPKSSDKRVYTFPLKRCSHTT